MNRLRQFLATLPILLLAGAAFLLGVNWGLPSRAADHFLFGSRQPWSGAQLVRLAPLAEAEDRAADVSQNPLGRAVGPVVVNATDADRARIVRRYRLMSYQPDEFATFAALARMKPSKADLDPRMYKYGGLWVYPVGGLLKAAAALHFIDLRPDMTWYLDHPEAFGKFYVIARAYSALWGLIGVVAIFLLIRRITGRIGPAAVGAVCFCLMPVVVNAAHEAKPHLAGAVLILLAVLAGARYVERGGSWVPTAVLCGLAAAMVPSAMVALTMLPVMFALRGRIGAGEAKTKKWFLNCAAAGAISLLVFVATNPYLAIDLVRHRGVLESNVGNSAAFYSPGLSPSGVLNALLLIGLGASFLVAIVGILGAAALGARAVRRRAATSEEEVRRRAAGLLLAAPAVIVGLLFVILARGQPADYARFALPLDLFLLVEAVVAVATFLRPGWWRCGAYAALIAGTVYMGHIYVHHFLRDCTGDATRVQAAERLDSLLSSGKTTLASSLEPAPWSMPPVNLFDWKIVVDRGRREGGPLVAPLNGEAVFVRPVDVAPGSLRNVLMSAPISWASKPFVISDPARQARNTLRENETLPR